jgi:uncharacterized membrane-anchored protein YhcB (DUF1043 family)
MKSELILKPQPSASG